MRNLAAGNSGFTLIELMITVTIAAILVTVAVPSFNNFIKKNRLDTQQNRLYSSINLARSEAVTRSRSVTICARGTNASCGTDWSLGWIIYQGSSSDTPTEATILRRFEPLTGNNTLSFTGATRLSFDSRGFAATTGSFALCSPDPTLDSDRRKITIANTGRATLSSGASISCN